MAQYNWLQFTKRVTVKTGLHEIYEAWATQKGLESFFLRQALFTSKEKKIRPGEETIQPADSYEWRWHGYPDSTVEYGKVLTTNSDRYLSFTFSNGCIVTITIKKELEEAICELVQDMTPADESMRQTLYIECELGWAFYLANLKSVLEGGLDLRNKDEDIKHVINA